MFSSASFLAVRGTVLFDLKEILSLVVAVEVLDFALCDFFLFYSFSWWMAGFFFPVFGVVFNFLMQVCIIVSFWATGSRFFVAVAVAVVVAVALAVAVAVAVAMIVAVAVAVTVAVALWLELCLLLWLWL